MIAGIAGISAPLFLPRPAGPVALLACLLLFLIFLKFRRFPWIGAGLLGFVWGALYAMHGLQHTLPHALHDHEVEICGHVSGLPQVREEFTRFDFRLKEIHPVAAPGRRPARIGPLVRLRWYGSPPLAPGDRGCLRVRLRQPRGSANPGAYDHERRLFQFGVRATGIVRDGRLDSGIARGVDFLRDQVRTRLAGRFAAREPAGALLPALVVGDRGGLDPAMRDVLQRTGTAHLLAISGLHVGLLAGACFFAGRGLARLTPLHRLWPAPRVGALAALLGAVAYALLAGFGLPVQRALIMLACGLFPLLFGYIPRISDVILLAVLLVMLRDPMALLDGGFWLSFGAVAVLLYTFCGRPAAGGPGWKWGRAQGVLFVALAPLLLVLGIPVAPLAPLVNLVAVPLVGCLVVPLALLGTVALAVWEPAGGVLLGLCGLLLDWGWRGLAAVAAAGPVWLPPVPGPLRLLLCLCGILLVLAPRGLHLRGPGWVCLLAVCLPRAPVLDEERFRATVLDVGHGLAVLVQTRNHALLYDTGYGEGDSGAGPRAVLPALRHAGVTRLDRVLLSHADRDHSGGYAFLAPRVAIANLQANREPPGGSGGRRQPCRGGQQWTWNGVRFEILHPLPGDRFAAENDRSCVLRVAAPGGSLLLSGDIERAAEYRLLARHGTTLRSDVLVAPHHGSRTSSSRLFINAVGAGDVVYPTAWPSRFGHPHPTIATRYRDSGARGWNTGRDGAVVISSGVPGARPGVEAWRDRDARYWRQPRFAAARGQSVVELGRIRFWSGFAREV